MNRTRMTKESWILWHLILVRIMYIMLNEIIVVN